MSRINQTAIALLLNIIPTAYGAPKATLTKEFSEQAQGAILKNSETGEMMAFVHGKRTNIGQQIQRKQGQAVNVEFDLKDITDDDKIAYALVAMNLHSKVKLVGESTTIANLDDMPAYVGVLLAPGSENANAIQKIYHLDQSHYNKMTASFQELAVGRPGQIKTINARDYVVLKSVSSLLWNDEGDSIADLLNEATKKDE